MARAALARFFAAVVPERAEARVRVHVNDRLLQVVQLAPGAVAQHVDVPAELLGEGRVKIALELEGRARPSFLAALRGFTPDVSRRDRPELRIVRQELLRPAPIEKGKPLAVGFTTLAQPAQPEWANHVTELALGELADVELSAALDSAGTSNHGGDTYTLTLPLPAGIDVLPGSIRGDFVSFAERPGELRFQLLGKQSQPTLRMTLLGRVVGDWRVLPPVIRSNVELDRAASGDALTLRVLPRGATPRDSYRPTPDELLDRARRRFNAGERAAAAVPLEQLLAEFGPQLKDDAFRDAARMLLFVALDSGDAPRIVRSFEVLKEKDPEFTLAVETVRQVAAAYRSIAEHERALELEEALIDETFGRDLQVTALLTGEKRWRDAFALRERLWLEYPDSAAVKQSYLALSDEMLSLAPQAHESAELRAQNLDRVTLQRDGMRILMRFLAFAPSDPLAPEAGLALVSAWLSLADWDSASALAERLAKRWKEPRFADSFLYSKAVAEWSEGHDDVARSLLERIATADYVDAAGHHTPSINRDLAWYILAQIHHARRDATAAALCYERIAEAFPDAREALQGIRERVLSLPEATSARPGQKATIAVTSKNLAEAELLVYSVDLMTLCLREKNLSGIAGVNLAGIAPVTRVSVALAKEAVLAPATTTVELPLPAAGAYLVLARSEEHHASGLVLVSPLELQVKEDSGGRVRTHVVDGASGAYVRDVDVRVIGSANDAFIAGRTDPRGLFVADRVVGSATVIARHGNSDYAFWRGTRLLGEADKQQQVDRANAEFKDAATNDAERYLKNVLELNRSLQNQRAENLQGELRKQGKGVQIKKVGDQ